MSVFSDPRSKLEFPGIEHEVTVGCERVGEGCLYPLLQRRLLPQPDVPLRRIVKVEVSFGASVNLQQPTLDLVVFPLCVQSDQEITGPVVEYDQRMKWRLDITAQIRRLAQKSGPSLDHEHRSGKEHQQEE